MWLAWLLGCCPDRCPELARHVGGCAAWPETPWGSAEAFAGWCPAWREEVSVAGGDSTCAARFDEVLALGCDDLAAWEWTAADAGR